MFALTPPRTPIFAFRTCALPPQRRLRSPIFAFRPRPDPGRRHARQPGRPAPVVIFGMLPVRRFSCLVCLPTALCSVAKAFLISSSCPSRQCSVRSAKSTDSTLRRWSSSSACAATAPHKKILPRAAFTCISTYSCFSREVIRLVGATAGSSCSSSGGGGGSATAAGRRGGSAAADIFARKCLP